MKKLEKLTVFFLIIILVLLNVILFSVFFVFSDEEIKKIVSIESETGQNDVKEEEIKKNKLIIDEYKGEFQVYQNDKLINSFFDYNEAIKYAAKYENASVKRYNGNFWLWDNTPQYNVYIDGKDDFKPFKSFADAATYARKNKYADIYYRKNNKFVWNNHEEIKGSIIIENINHITQLPELKRGCEVTSLAMLLNYKGFNTDKMTLASEIKKDTTPYNKIDGKVYFGNPNNGFVGDIYDYSKKGLGVYHLPIFALLSSYAKNDAMDLTGCEFEDLYYFLNKNSPVWVIINTKYDELPQSSFENWITPDGEVRVTYNEHSVLIVGYDDKYIYINDPLSKYGYTKKEKIRFIKAWKQMGRQAVTIKK